MKRPTALTIILWILTLCCIFLALKSSNEPILEIFKNTSIEIYFRQFTTGNTLIFNLSIGFLVSIFIYIFIVWIPDRRRKKIIKKNIEEEYRNFKENTIYVLLDACYESKNSELVDKLCDLKYFREFFMENISETQSRWDAVWNGLNEYLLKEISVELGILLNSVTFVLNNVYINDQNVFSFFRRLSHSVYKLKYTTLEDYDLRLLHKFLFEIFGGWSMADGPHNEEIIKTMISKI